MFVWKTVALFGDPDRNGETCLGSVEMAVEAAGARPDRQGGGDTGGDGGCGRRSLPLLITPALSAPTRRPGFLPLVITPSPRRPRRGRASCRLRRQGLALAWLGLGLGLGIGSWLGLGLGFGLGLDADALAARAAGHE